MSTLNQQQQMQQQKMDQSVKELEKVTGNIPSVIAPDEPFNPDPEISPETPEPEIPKQSPSPDISQPAPAPLNPTSPTELPPHIDPTPREI